MAGRLEQTDCPWLSRHPLGGQVILLGALAVLGTMAFLFRVRIPHTSVFIETRSAFAFAGFVLLRRWWLAGLLAVLLAVPWFSNLPFHIGFFGNLSYLLPAVVVFRLGDRTVLQRTASPVLYAAGIFLLTLVCYQLFSTPIVWAVLALLENRNLLQGALQGWRTQPFFVESLIVGIMAASGLAVARSIDQLRRQQRRLDHLNRILRAIRNVNQLITQQNDRQALLDEACSMLVETRGFQNAWIVLLDDAGQPLESVHHAGFEGEFAAMTEGLRQGRLPRCVRKALEGPGVEVVEEPDRDCADCPLHVRHDRSSAMTVRLEHEGKVFGWLSVSVPADFVRDEQERELLEEIAGDLGFALDSMQTREQHQHSEQQRELLQAQYRQAQKMEALGQLTGGVAHDFNNLLQVINGGLDMALMDLPEDHPFRESLQDIADAGQRAATLVGQLLVFSRRQALKMETLDLNGVVEDLLKMLRRLIGEDIRLTWSPAENLPPLHADHGMLEQVLLNLCLNARDAMPDGGTLAIQTRSVLIDEAFCETHAVASSGPHAVLVVRDTGCGMDEETLQRIFEPFFTTKKTGKGTGLGLATVYGIVKQHNGFIHVHSDLDKGTLFELYWPVRDGEETSREPDRNQRQAPAGGTVLLVEDDPLVIRSTQRLLEHGGYTVLTAPNGRVALKVFRDHDGQIDLLVLDLIMPDLDGAETLRRIRRLRPDVPALFISGYSQTTARQHEGLDDVLLLQKPFTGERLYEAVRHATGKQ